MVRTPRYAEVEEEESGMEDSSSDSEIFVSRLHNTWGSRLVYASLIGMACLGFATAGWLAHPLNATAQTDTQPRSQPVELAHPTLEAQSTPQAASRFLASEDLMSVVAKQSIKSNPRCHSPDSADWANSDICNEKALVPHLVKHMAKHVQTMPKPIREHLDTIMIHGPIQEGLKSAVPHLGDPRIHTVASDVVNGMQEVSGMSVDEAAKHLTQKLAHRKADMDDLRKKLFPMAPPVVDAALAHSTLSSIFTGNGIRIKHEADENNRWNTNFEINLNTSDLQTALETMPKGRELSSALFAPCTLVCIKRAPLDGPPPPRDFAGSVVASIGIPFSHIIMAALHYTGRISLPYWTKVLLTLEDVLTVGGTTGLPLIGAICDFVFMWTPRGYVYPEGSASEYPDGFLPPPALALGNQRAAYSHSR